MKNPTLLQFFHWYTPGNGTLWSEIADRAADLSNIGINMVWLPPAYKGSAGGHSVGYDSYDLFDLGNLIRKAASPPSMVIKRSSLRPSTLCGTTMFRFCWMFRKP